jgi:hypothetical protein
LPTEFELAWLLTEPVEDPTGLPGLIFATIPAMLITDANAASQRVFTINDAFAKPKSRL